MSAAISNHNLPTSKPIRDPTTLTEPIPPSFPLTQGNLQDIIEYCTTPYGQISIISRIARPRGSHLCDITTHYAIQKPTWSSFQSSPTHHAELDSALVYMNHSCDPTVEIEVRTPDADGNYPDGIGGEVRVARDRDLQVGDHLTFFYPSTEWAGSRPFQCLCGSERKKCIGIHRGSSVLSKEVLNQYFINKHIHDLMAERDQMKGEVQEF